MKEKGGGITGVFRSRLSGSPLASGIKRPRRPQAPNLDAPSPRWRDAGGHAPGPRLPTCRTAPVQLLVGPKRKRETSLRTTRSPAAGRVWLCVTARRSSSTYAFIREVAKKHRTPEPRLFSCNRRVYVYSQTTWPCIFFFPTEHSNCKSVSAIYEKSSLNDEGCEQKRKFDLKLISEICPLYSQSNDYAANKKINIIFFSNVFWLAIFRGCETHTGKGGGGGGV